MLVNWTVQILDILNPTRYSILFKLSPWFSGHNRDVAGSGNHIFTTKIFGLKTMGGNDTASVLVKFVSSNFIRNKCCCAKSKNKKINEYWK